LKYLETAKSKFDNFFESVDDYMTQSQARTRLSSQITEDNYLQDAIEKTPKDKKVLEEINNIFTHQDSYKKLNLESGWRHLKTEENKPKMVHQHNKVCQDPLVSQDDILVNRIGHSLNFGVCQQKANKLAHFKSALLKHNKDVGSKIIGSNSFILTQH